MRCFSKALLAAGGLVATVLTGVLPGVLTGVWTGAVVPSAAAETGFAKLLAEAEGQTVYWNAWGGDDQINAYIDWVGDAVEERYGIDLIHVKLSDTAEAVARVLAEKTAGRDAGGSVDLIWINGENFARMKANGLLAEPWVESLPNFALIDTEGKPTTVLDFTIPTDGLEAPWGMAQYVLMYETETVAAPPRDFAELKAFAAKNPGRFTYPQPPDFLGSTFLKQALYELLADTDQLQRPASEAIDAEAALLPLWDYLDALHPTLWRRGQTFPANGPALRQLLADGEVDMAMAFNPAEASGQIAQGLLPETVRTFVFEKGTIGNTHFVAIPYNANAMAAAKVVANFLMSVDAQVKKQDPAVWGDFTVLDVAGLPEDDQARFAALDLGIATLSPTELGTPLPEPHPSWMELIEDRWTKRYATGG
ncbi:MAG: ABC transporter substrate-binding protein [Alphaproteobacteria bacterium]|nr:ABC transporter substrate-binding protein [Alphaproteobacteria bacterium]